MLARSESKNLEKRKTPGRRPPLMRWSVAVEVAFMPFERLDGVLGYARRLAARSATDRPADAELVARWVGQRDEAAFELLVFRHGSLVMSVCRRVLRDAHSAEDAFQATFMTLARKAGSLGHGEAVGSW